MLSITFTPEIPSETLPAGTPVLNVQSFSYTNTSPGNHQCAQHFIQWQPDMSTATLPHSPNPLALAELSLAKDRYEESWAAPSKSFYRNTSPKNTSLSGCIMTSWSLKTFTHSLGQLTKCGVGQRTQKDSISLAGWVKQPCPTHTDPSI